MERKGELHTKVPDDVQMCLAFMEGKKSAEVILYLLIVVQERQGVLPEDGEEILRGCVQGHVGVSTVCVVLKFFISSTKLVSLLPQLPSPDR